MNESIHHFQELGNIYLDVMKDSVFETDIDDYDSDIETPDPDMLHNGFPLYHIINSPHPKTPKDRL